MERLLGAHMSIAGGYYLAAEAATRLGMWTCQLFTKNNNQWRSKPISDDEAARFRNAVEIGSLRHCCSHSSYLINLASADEHLWQKSVDAYVEEIERAERLGLDGVVIHPGSAGESDEAWAIDRVVTALDEVLDRTRSLRCEVWLETTAGQGKSLGHRFEHLAKMIQGVRNENRIGVCVDTCHIFAAGYPIHSAEEYAATFADFDRLVGLGRVRAFHLNDSKRELGSRVDRHEHIGEGKLGLEPFRHLLNDARFASLPMYLETPKGTRDGQDLDAINLAALKSLIVPAGPAPSKPTRKPRKKATARD